MAKKTRYTPNYKITVKDYKSGGQGTVEIIENDEGKKFAGKYLRNPKREDRFRTEIINTDKLKHPNIVKIIDSYLRHEIKKENKPWYIMPIAEKDLQELIDCGYFKENPLDIFFILRKIVEGIKFAHSQDVAHRDLKPTNILLNKKGDKFIPSICDFGLSKNLKIIEDLTEQHEQVGSRYYIAPEYEDGKYEDDPKPSDIYALGKILWVLLSNQNFPFNREKHRNPKYNLENNSYLNNELLLRTVNLVLDRIILENPKDRIKIEEFLKDIEMLEKYFQDNDLDSISKVEIKRTHYPPPVQVSQKKIHKYYADQQLIKYCDELFEEIKEIIGSYRKYFEDIETGTKNIIKIEYGYGLIKPVVYPRLPRRTLQDIISSKTTGINFIPQEYYVDYIDSVRGIIDIILTDEQFHILFATYTQKKDDSRLNPLNNHNNYNYDRNDLIRIRDNLNGIVEEFVDCSIKSFNKYYLKEE